MLQIKRHIKSHVLHHEKKEDVPPNSLIDREGYVMDALFSYGGYLMSFTVFLCSIAIFCVNNINYTEMTVFKTCT